MFRIETARQSDVGELIELLQTLFAIEQDFSADAERQRRGLFGLLEATPQRASIWVARSDQGVIGMVSGQLVTSTAEGAPSVWIEDLVVAQAFRGRGVGRALLDAVLAWARQRGASRAQLLADRDNHAAIAFYRHCGMQDTNLVALRLADLAGSDRT